MLKLSEQEFFNNSLINVLKDLMEEVDSMQEAMYDVNREMEILRKNQKEMLENKNTIIEMKNNFDGLISRVISRTKGRTSELEDVTIETAKTQKQRKKTE